MYAVRGADPVNNATPCTHCNGSGGEVQEAIGDNGARISVHIACRACGGTGRSH